MTPSDPSRSYDAPRRLTARPGPWAVHEALTGLGIGPDTHMVLIGDGLVLRTMHVGEQHAAQLLGPGDLVEIVGAADAELAVAVTFDVLVDVRATVLGQHAAAASPRVAGALLAGARRQMQRSSVQLAIGHLPRVEERLIALMTHAAERWGRVGPDGFVVPIALTHQALGHLIGASRPTVSLALKSLDAEGMLHRRPDGDWVLTRHAAALVGGFGAPRILSASVSDRPPGLQGLLDASAALRRRVAEDRERRAATSAAAAP